MQTQKDVFNEEDFYKEYKKTISWYREQIRFCKERYFDIHFPDLIEPLKEGLDHALSEYNKFRKKYPQAKRKTQAKEKIASQKNENDSILTEGKIVEDNDIAAIVDSTKKSVDDILHKITKKNPPKISQKIPEINVSYKASDEPLAEIRCSQDTYEILSNIWNQDIIDLQEQFSVLYLTRKNKVLGYRVLGLGNDTRVSVDVKLLVSIALKCHADSVILCHNHPSGITKPSSLDKDVTCKIKHACSYFDIKLLDHVIISSKGYYSFWDEGLLDCNK